MRDRGGKGETRGDDRIRFTSAILPKFARRAGSLDAVLPTLYLRGLSSGDFGQAPQASPRQRCIGPLSASYRPLEAGMAGGPRALAAAGPVGPLLSLSRRYLWADGVCLRGLAVAPEPAVGDGALGFWKALEEVFPTTRQQRCWAHKTANVLTCLPKSRQAAAKGDLHAIRMADGRAEAEKAIDRLEAKYAAKYPRAVACLTKDREALLAFNDFPAEHWQHIHQQSYRERVCDRQAPHDPKQRLPFAWHCHDDGLHVGDDGVQALAAPIRQQSVAQTD